MKPLALALSALLCCAAAGMGHDSWVQTNAHIVRVGDNVHIDLMLGNHGNDHRDFKLAGKVTLEGTALHVLAPDGKKYDLKGRLEYTVCTPKEGYSTTRFAGGRPGLYMVAHTSD